MANLLQLINKSKIIEEKAKTIAGDLMSQFKHGEIKTKTELLYKTFITMKKFYDSIGEPSMVVRYASGAPSSADYNSTMKEIYNDISGILVEGEALTSAISDSYNQVEIDRQSLENQLHMLEKKLEKAEFKLNNVLNGEVFIDSFINMNYMDSGSCKLTAAAINTNYKYMSLATQEAKVVNESASVEILNDSNGFPGNTHQVNVINNEVKFLGEEGVHLNLADILDSNSDTWFEYEIYKISDETLFQTLNIGFNYHEGIKWTTDDNKLTLAIRVSFNKPELINVFSVSPFIAPDKDAVPAIITDIIISDGKGTVRNLIGGVETFSQDKVYSFPKQYCKTATIVIQQDLSYSTTAGHLYYKELNNENIDYFKINEVKFNQRVDGDLPSVENLGIIYDDQKQTYIQPKFSYGQTIDNEADIKDNLFNVPKDTGNKKAYLETIEANRYHIGIRDISLANYSYEPESEYVSTEFKTENPITEVSLLSDEFIPEQFDANVDWITYDFSIDDGKQWSPIIPTGTFKNEGYTYYLINSGVPAELRRNDIGYIEVADDIYSVKLRITLKRPTDITDSEYYSPIVYEYKLKVK